MTAPAVTDAALVEVWEIVEAYNQGRIKTGALSYMLRGRVASQMPCEIQAAFEHAAEAHRIYLVAESPEGGRDVHDMDPKTYAHTCLTLLIEALADLVRVLEAEGAPPVLGPELRAELVAEHARRYPQAVAR